MLYFSNLNVKMKYCIKVLFYYIFQNINIEYRDKYKINYSINFIKYDNILITIILKSVGSDGISSLVFLRNYTNRFRLYS